jgi:hypothetical protein
VLVDELVAPQPRLDGKGEDGQLAVGVQRGTDQQAHHGVGDGPDLRSVLGPAVGGCVRKGLADDPGKVRRALRAGVAGWGGHRGS